MNNDANTERTHADVAEELRRFLSEWTRPGGDVRLGRLYDAYVVWQSFAGSGRSRMSPATFSAELHRLDFRGLWLDLPAQDVHRYTARSELPGGGGAFELIACLRGLSFNRRAEVNATEVVQRNARFFAAPLGEPFTGGELRAEDKARLVREAVGISGWVPRAGDYMAPFVVDEELRAVEAPAFAGWLAIDVTDPADDGGWRPSVDVEDVRLFLDECVDVSPGSVLPAETLYRAYFQWATGCESAGGNRPASSYSFSIQVRRVLRAAGVRHRSVRGYRVYDGVDLKPSTRMSIAEAARGELRGRGRRLGPWLVTVAVAVLAWALAMLAFLVMVE